MLCLLHYLKSGWAVRCPCQLPAFCCTHHFPCSPFPFCVPHLTCFPKPLLYSLPFSSPMSTLYPSPGLFPQAYAESTTILLPEACAVPIPPSTLRSVLCPPPIAAPGPCYAHSSLLSQARAVSLKKFTFSPQNKVLPLLHTLYSLLHSFPVQMIPCWFL